MNGIMYADYSVIRQSIPSYIREIICMAKWGFMESQKPTIAQIMGTYIMPLSAAPRNLQMEVIVKFSSLRLTAWLLAL